MKLPAFLRKPRWLSKDAAVRRQAVQRDSEPELIAALPRLAREDTDAGVRQAALKRLADPALAQGLARDDTDPGVRAEARRLWLELMAGTHAQAPALGERLRLLKAQEDAELVEHIARHAPEAELRAAALARASRPAFLLDRALEEPDPAARLALVARIDDEAQLARLAERARRTDKSLNRAARERIEALRLARGDAATIVTHARLLCEEVEQLVRDAGSAVAEAEIHARWARVEPQVEPPMRQRYEAARQLLETSRNPPPPKVEEPPAPVAELPDAGDAGNAPAEPGMDDAAPAPAEPVPSAEEIVAAQIAQARFAAALDEAEAARKQKAARQRELVAELETAVAECAAALDAGASADAHVARARIEQLRRSIDDVPAALQRRLGSTEARHAELRRWQHWSDNQRRQQLCEEVEALAGSGLHPDAVASRVREAQAEWNRLAELERQSGARPDGLGRRFHAACRAAFAPTEAYFRKRQEIRDAYGQELEAVLERSRQLPPGAERPAINAQRGELVAALRDLDRLDPRQRKAMAARLKEALDALDARIRALDQGVEAAKALLITEAEDLTRDGLQRGAAATARELQQRWKEVGNGRRSRDQAQWKTFRAAIDAVFGALDAARNERSAREIEQRAEAEALCQRVEELATAETPERAALARLRTEWDALRVRDEALSRRFEAAAGQVEDALGRRERERRHARFGAWLARYELCRTAETGAEDSDALRMRWAEAADSDIARPALAARMEAALAGDPAAPASDFEAFRAIVFELEGLAGMEPTEADREQRRQLQVERLAARMRGEGGNDDPAVELATLLERWCELAPISEPELDKRFLHAARAALATLP
ncbi:MAG: DUF349 domain-containing protein [Xanthomonadales bacterium]|nr:DUF349 domain-containing protein [Xanthomonadales bacterium]